VGVLPVHAGEGDRELGTGDPESPTGARAEEPDRFWIYKNRNYLDLLNFNSGLFLPDLPLLRAVSIRVFFPASAVAVSGEPGVAASVVRNAIARAVPVPILCVFPDAGEMHRFLRHELAPALALRSRGLEACLVRQVGFGKEDLPTEAVHDALPDLFPEMTPESGKGQEWMPLEVAVALLPELPAGSRPRVLVATATEDLLSHPERIRRGVFRSLALLAKRRGVSVVLAMAGEPVERLANLPGMQWVGELLPDAPGDGGAEPGGDGEPEASQDRGAFRGRPCPGRRIRGAQALAVRMVSAMMPAVLAMALYWFLAGAGEESRQVAGRAGDGGGEERRLAGVAGWGEAESGAGLYLE